MPTVESCELSRLDAVETATIVRSGELSATEVVAAAIERAEALAPVLNAIPACDYERALEQAEGDGAFCAMRAPRAYGAG